MIENGMFDARYRRADQYPPNIGDWPPAIGLPTNSRSEISASLRLCARPKTSRWNATMTNRRNGQVMLVVAFVVCVYFGSSAAHDATAFADTPEVSTAAGASRFPVVSDPKPLTPLMERELRGCFDFFWNEWVSDPGSPTYGMTNGDYVGLGRYSPIPIESQGFYFPMVVIGVERGWITREEGSNRILITLKTLKKLKHIQRGLDRLEFRHVSSSQGRPVPVSK